MGNTILGFLYWEAVSFPAEVMAKTWRTSTKLGYFGYFRDSQSSDSLETISDSQ